jgi:hypothetical protein
MPKLRAPLFVLSHMRSYSSLLSHVLGSHPDIDGYCETHLRYHFSFDVMRLHWKVQRLTGEPLRGRFVLDKILHNYSVSRAILENPYTRGVFLLREPENVLQSIIHMGTHLDPLEQNTNLEQVTGYYEARLRRLAELAPVLGWRAAFLPSEALIHRTDQALEFLRAFLGLNQPLERHYRSFAKTGEPGFGDPSPAIRSGEIRVRSQPRAEVPVPDSLIERVRAAHAECVEACHRHCVPLRLERVACPFSDSAGDAGRKRRDFFGLGSASQA